MHLALDDFGTGFSCLSYLKRFPIDALKIDRSFVRDLATDADCAGIVSAVISMGKNLNMRVIAEGVETRDQLEFLQEHSCPEGQGYYFAQPMVAGEVTQLIARHDRLLVLPQSATHEGGDEFAAGSMVRVERLEPTAS